jgi:hypothetical protein
LTFVISSGMVHVDMRTGKIAAFPYPWVRFSLSRSQRHLLLLLMYRSHPQPTRCEPPLPRQPDTQFAVVAGPDPDPSTQSWRQRLWWTFHQRHGLGRGLHFFSGSHVNDVFDLRLGWKERAVRLFWSVWKGAPRSPSPSQPLSVFVLSQSRSYPRAVCGRLGPLGVVFPRPVADHDRHHRAHLGRQEHGAHLGARSDQARVW